MNKISFSLCLANGWQLYKKYGLALAGICAIFFVVVILMSLPVTIFAISESQNDYGYGSSSSLMVSMMPNISNLLTSIVSWIFSVGFITLILKLTSGALQRVTFATYKQPIIVYLKYFAVEFLSGIAVLIGLLLCIIPGIFLLAKLQFAPYYILDHPEAGIDDAFKVSWKLTNNDNFWSVLGLIILNIIIDIVGMLCCGIGIIFAVPYTYLVMSTAYYQLIETPISQPGEYYEN